MYCIECGSLNSYKSKFCSQCGNKQTEDEPSLKKIEEIIIVQNIKRTIIKNLTSSFGNPFLKKAMVFYLAWLMLHIGLLLIAADNILGNGYYYTYEYRFNNDMFWPFSEKSVIQNYDIREFLVYSIFPPAIMVIWSMVSTLLDNDNKTKTQNQ